VPKDGVTLQMRIRPPTARIGAHDAHDPKTHLPVLSVDIQESSGLRHQKFEMPSDFAREIVVRKAIEVDRQ